ncbi:MAG TPA: zinc-binding dehydrogenase, partial [Burkholderiaceae bacterium]|nr:zinc-binding dehydrogenase [Burkholderiaceae bacterium]
LAADHVDDDADAATRAAPLQPRADFLGIRAECRVQPELGGELSAGALFGMAIGGRWVQVGRMGAATATIDLNELSRRRVHLVGATFRTRTLDECVALAQAAWRDAGDIAARGALRLPIDRVFPLDDAAQAHERLRAAGAGRVMMTA